MIAPRALGLRGAAGTSKSYRVSQTRQDHSSPCGVNYDSGACTGQQRPDAQLERRARHKAASTASLPSTHEKGAWLAEYPGQRTAGGYGIVRYNVAPRTQQRCSANHELHAEHNITSAQCSLKLPLPANACHRSSDELLHRESSKRVFRSTHTAPLPPFPRFFSTKFFPTHTARRLQA